MKVSYNILKKYVQFDWSPEELAARLTMLGIEVEGVEKLGGEFEKVVVAQILSFEKHPNADKLSVCRVADGAGERQIVCGAHNFKAGDKVPLALPGCSLPVKAGEEPFVIKVGKIRGYESHGMMCSPQELQLPDDIDGLLILDPSAKVGQPFAEHIGRSGSDTIYDLEITPNRPDLNSFIGIAREISVLTGNPLQVPEVKLPSGTETAPVSVRIDDPELCPRYVARVIRNVKIGPSPAWLVEALSKAGIRSINNVVDVTNFVMLEVGQPLHAFDMHLVAGGQIIVRRAGDGEQFITLDGQKHQLNTHNLLIADPEKGIALAGVMGGQNSEIQPDTKDVILESAAFKPQSIRATSKQVGLRTDASYRFERGSDVEICDWASRRAAQLILETAGGVMLSGNVDVYPRPFQPKPIDLRFAKTDELLGIQIQPQQQAQYLRSAGFRITQENQNSCVAEAPSFRVDIKREADLIEEIVRFHGIEKIPSTAPRGAIGCNEFDAVYDQIGDARRILTALGLTEAQDQTLISSASAKLVSTDVIPLANPLSADMDALRPSLLPGLIDAVRHNVSRRTTDVALFEIGKVFNDKSAEQLRIGITVTGQADPTFWQGNDRNAKYDVFDLKGMLEEFLETFGIRGITITRNTSPSEFFLESAAVALGGKLPLGTFGQLMPALARKYDLRDPVFVAELDLGELLARRNPAKSFKPLPQFPSVRRDIAMVLDETITHEQVAQVVKKTKPQNLEGFELFDVFRGKNIPEGQKSAAYAFTYRSPEKTLTDAEVNAAHEKLLEQLKQQLKATVRDS